MNAPRFEIRKAANNEWFFTLKAANGEVILVSETYKQKQSAQDTVNAIKRIAADALIIYPE